MSLIFRTNLTAGGKRLYNLLNVSHIDLKKNELKFYLSHSREEIFGTFLLFGGGKNQIETVTYPNEEEAQKEFDRIGKTLEDYYSKDKK